jgi:glutamyl-tRNA synthetase
VDFYKQVGYLPDAILNYLFLLGWAHADGKSEFFTRQEMIDLFDWESEKGSVSKAPASFDAKKLFAFQARYMQMLPNAEKVEMVLPFLVRARLVRDADAGRPYVTRVVEAAGPRMTVAGDILDYDYLFLPDDQVGFDPALAEKAVKDAYKKAERVPPLAEVLPKLRALVAGAEPFTHDTLKAATEALAQTEGAKHGPLSQVLRVSTTGKEVGFSAYDTLALLGRDRCLARIDRALK